MLKTPVLFLIFNRPDVTFRVFEEIRKAQPEQLYIAADGPRQDKDGEGKKCEQARSIVNKIDWKCEVKTLFRDNNLGCRVAVSSAINWFFDNVEEGIIIEDDCLPDPSFFTFCQTLLEKYRDNEKIMHISGTNFQKGLKRGSASYYFSAMPMIWGWATWKRAWQQYSLDLQGLEKCKIDGLFIEIFRKKYLADFYFNKLIQTKQGNINTWDYQWSFTIWKQRGICITPNINLISNIGFGTEATHTATIQNEYAELKTERIDTISHPSEVQINYAADNYFYKFQTGIKGEFWHYKNLLIKKVMKYGADFKQKIKTKFH
jgi:hypothetical protein